MSESVPAASASEEIWVELGPRSYSIRVVTGGPDGLGPFARDSLARSWAGKHTSRALIVCDHHVEPLLDPWRRSLEASGLRTDLASLPPGEASKDLARVAELHDRLIALRADRHTAVVAIGGGVMGDLAGFVAATFARGVPLLMVPTSLLAQVDSSVGGKVGVNRPAAKNIVGSFHQPAGVWIDTEALATLPVRELRCGLAEVVKYGVILDGDFFDELESTAARVLELDPSVVRRVVSHSCRLKAMVVTKDEREETGLRAVLNFGHTIAHAIEAVSGYDGDYLHGEAVSAGMVAESRLAERLGWIGADTTERLKALLARLGLPVDTPGLDPAALRQAMALDKKNRSGRTRFVLPRCLGQVELTDAPTEDDLVAVLREMVGT